MALSSSSLSSCSTWGRSGRASRGKAQHACRVHHPQLHSQHNRRELLAGSTLLFSSLGSSSPPPCVAAQAATVFHEVSVPLPPAPGDGDTVELRDPPTRVTATGRIVASEWMWMNDGVGSRYEPAAAAQCSSEQARQSSGGHTFQNAAAALPGGTCTADAAETCRMLAQACSQRLILDAKGSIRQHHATPTHHARTRMHAMRTHPSLPLPLRLLQSATCMGTWTRPSAACSWPAS